MDGVQIFGDYMDIQVKFAIGDHAYLLEYAKKGILAEVRIIAVRAYVEYGNPSIDYQLYGVNVFNKTWYPEYNVKTFIEAKQIAVDYLNRSRAITQDDLELLVGDFAPVDSQVNVI